MAYSVERIKTAEQRRKIIFWVEDMPPSQGGIQKRILDFVSGTKEKFDVVVVQRSGYSQHFSGVKTVTFGNPENYLRDSYTFIVNMISESSIEPLIYVSKVFCFHDDTHLSLLEDLSNLSCKVVLRLASTRSANFVTNNRDDVDLGNLRFHCLNDSDFRCIQEWHSDVKRFNNSSVAPLEPTEFSNKPTYAFCGRIVESKNLASFLTAWSEFQQPGKSLKVWGDASSPYFSNEIAPLIEEIDDVEYLGVYEREDASVFNDFSVLVAPSVREGSSNVVVEAISHGRIVVGSDIPGIRELLPREYPFLIKSPFGTKEVLDALNLVRESAENEQDLTLLSAELRNFFLQNFSSDLELDEILSLARADRH
ncbi:MAG: glycosyltransferase family 4 protein [Pseudomonadota bacterium]